MSTFESLNKFVVPGALVQSTDDQLRAAGLTHSECFVLWSGIRDGDTFRFRTTHVPRQVAYRFSEGLCVRVDGTELHRLNVWLYEHNEELAAQIHSHPTEAYHSDTDDEFPIVTTRGGLSLVVPDFGEGGLRGEGVAAYRLGLHGWDELSNDEVTQLIFFEV
jgi:hypothetical protein